MKIRNVLLITLSLILMNLFLCGCSSFKGYEDAFSFNENMAAVKINGLFGFINSEGTLIITPEYEVADYFNKGIAIVKKNNFYGAIDVNNNIIVPFQYEELSMIDNSIFSAKKNGAYGCINKDEEILINFTYKNPLEIHPLSSDNIVAITTGTDGKKGIISTKSNINISPKYKNIYFDSVNNNLVTLVKFFDFADKYGILNLDTGFIIEPSSPIPLYFNEGLCPYMENEKYGYINDNGKFVIDPIYDSASSFSNNMAIVRLLKNTRLQSGLIDKTGKVLIPIEFNALLMVEEECKIIAINDSTSTTFDFNGNILSSESGALITKYLHPNIDKEETNIDKEEFNIEIQADSYGDPISTIKDNNGDILFKGTYSTIDPYENNELYIISRFSKYGCMNDRFIEIIPLKYDSLTYLTKDIFIAKENNKVELITKNNKNLFEETFDNAQCFRDYLIVLSKGDKKSIFNSTTKTLIAENLDDVKLCEDGFIPVCKENTWFYIDENGSKEF